MAWPIVLGLMSAASTLADNAEDNDQMRQRAQELGLKTAGINFSRDRHARAIEAQAPILQSNAEAQKRFVEANQAQAEADARVIAAAAGVAGDSVDAVISDTERTAAEAVTQIERDKKTKERQLITDYVDNQVNADLQKPAFDSTVDKGAGVLKAGLSFVSGYRLGI
jgi:hypothetical protein